MASRSQPSWRQCSQWPFFSSTLPFLPILYCHSLFTVILHHSPSSIAIKLETALLNILNVYFLPSGEHTAIVKLFILNHFLSDFLMWELADISDRKCTHRATYELFYLPPSFSFPTTYPLKRNLPRNLEHTHVWTLPWTLFFLLFFHRQLTEHTIGF